MFKFQPPQTKWAQKSPKKQTIDRGKTPSPVCVAKSAPVTTDITVNEKGDAKDENEKTDSPEKQVENVSEPVIDVGKENVEVNVAELDKETTVDTLKVEAQEVVNDQGVAVAEIQSDFKEIGESDVELDEIADYSFKRAVSPFRHSDSGLGTSVYSSSLSASSAENSPQHACSEVVTGGNLDVDLTTVSEETLAVCANITRRWSLETEPCNAETVSDVSELKENVSEEKEFEKVLVADNVDTKIGAKESCWAISDNVDQNAEGAENCAENGALTEENKDSNMCHDKYDNVDEHNLDCSSKTEESCDSQTQDCNLDEGAANIPVSNIDESFVSATTTKNSNKKSFFRSTSETSSNVRQGYGFSHGIESIGPMTTTSEVSSYLSNSFDSNKGATKRTSAPNVFSDSSESSLTFQQYCQTKRSLGPSKFHYSDTPIKKVQLPKKNFNPFPTKHVNQNRAKTGIKLGLYKQSTLEQFEQNLKGQSLVGN